LSQEEESCLDREEGSEMKFEFWFKFRVEFEFAIWFKFEPEFEDKFTVELLLLPPSFGFGYRDNDWNSWLRRGREGGGWLLKLWLGSWVKIHEELRLIRVELEFEEDGFRVSLLL